MQRIGLWGLGNVEIGLWGLGNVEIAENGIWGLGNVEMFQQESRVLSYAREAKRYQNDVSSDLP